MATAVDQRRNWITRWANLIVQWEDIRHQLKQEKTIYDALDLGNAIQDTDFTGDPVTEPNGTALGYTTKAEVVSAVSSFSTVSGGVESGFHNTNFEQMRP